MELAGPQGLDKVLDDNDLDVLVSPAYSVGYSAAAVAGYASISVPAGVAEDGRPGCVWMSGRFLDEPKLIALAYDLEQELGPRDVPEVPGRRAGSVRGCRSLRGAVRSADGHEIASRAHEDGEGGAPEGSKGSARSLIRRAIAAERRLNGAARTRSAVISPR